MCEYPPLTLDSPIACLDGIGPKRVALLGNLGIATLRGLLFHFPREYQDRRCTTPIAEACEGDTVTIVGESVKARNVRLRGRMSMAIITLKDDTGEITVTFFGRGFLANAFKPGTHGIFTGTVGNYKGLCLKNPEYEVLSGDEEDLINTGRIVPVYRLTEKVTQRNLRRWMRGPLDRLVPAIEETLPAGLRERHVFPPIRQAIRDVHFPGDLDAAHAARARFAYEELLAIQLGVLGARAARRHEEKGNRHVTGGPILEAFRAALPFTLTQAQQRAVADILEDMASPRPMLRLVQGDVGCGKTIVALHAMAAAADGGYQTALMAPTEVLAEQHYVSLIGLLEPLGLRVEQLTGAMRGAPEIRRRLARGESHIVVGTQALIQQKTEFHNLGLAIIDEQHRFGVCQRSTLLEKGLNPDILHMTATPIPRTLSITVYGGMDITVIDELPPGRLPVKTRRITPAKVPGLHEYVVKQACKGFQTYYICPLVEESETRGLAAVTTHFEELSTGPFAGLRTDVIHGRLDASEKDDTMRRFKAGEIDVLFSTSVIEVGVDVANATTMIVEDAPQFGLTQLHQLRGRVGRGSEQSHCFLLGKPKTDDGKRRIEILCNTASGFDIAEEDLNMRGPGEFYGVRQAGMSDLRAADLIRDVRLLDTARRDAREILRHNPALEGPEYEHLAAAARRFQSLSA